MRMLEMVYMDERLELTSHYLAMSGLHTQETVNLSGLKIWYALCANSTDKLLNYRVVT